MVDDVATDAHPEAGAIQGVEAPSDASGMTPDDAATSSFDDWDRSQNGIAEGERENLGKHLKYHADAAGTTIPAGLDSLIGTAISLRHGSAEQKRETIGGLIDEYNIHAMPSAEPSAETELTYADIVDPASGEAIGDEAAGMRVVQDFIAANPAAGDTAIQAAMIDVVADMRRQNYTPRLDVALQYALARDPRFSGAAQQAQTQAADAAHLARAKQGTGQVSGGASTAPSARSDDIADIIGAMVP